MVLKKPSKSYCSVCPSKVGERLGGDDENEGGNDEVEINGANKNIRVDQSKAKRMAWRNRNKVQRRPVREKRRHTFSHRGGSRRHQASVQPTVISNQVQSGVAAVQHKRIMASRARNHYFGMDVFTEVVRPLEGDVFTNMMTGEVHFRRHGIWNLIPGNGPRCYLGESVNDFENEDGSEKGYEGDLFLEKDSGRMMVRQDNSWQEFRLFESQKATEHESSLVGKLQGLLREVGSDREMILNHRHQHDGVDDESLSDVGQQTMEIKKGLHSEEFEVELTPISAKMTGEYRHMSATCLQKLHPSIHAIGGDGSTASIDVAPEGDLHMEVHFNQEDGWMGDIEVDLNSWIKYTDHQKKIWQTVVCLSNLEVFDIHGKRVNGDDLLIESMESGEKSGGSGGSSGGGKLVDLKQKLKTITTLADHARVRIRSGVAIGSLMWTIKLVAYLPEVVGKKDFFSIEFKEMNQPIKLPQMKVHFVSAGAA